jgi:hypothetical protein
MNSNHVLSAQIESLVVDFVRDFKIGLRPSSAAYISAADFTVVRRRRVLREPAYVSEASLSDECERPIQ